MTQRPGIGATGTFIDAGSRARRDATLYARISQEVYDELGALVARYSAPGRRLSLAAITDDVLRLGLERVAQIESELREGE